MPLSKAGAAMKVSAGRRWWALAALALSVLVVGLDLTVLNLALPTLATDLHASTAQLQWIVDAYSLVLAAMVLPAGLLGDRFGRKRLLLGALLLFGAASLACAYASSAGPVIALALLAVAVLLPESRSLVRRRLDLAGIVVSGAGLAALTYGAIEAGQRGWGDGVA